jgi:hypothetical protein
LLARVTGKPNNRIIKNIEFAEKSILRKTDEFSIQSLSPALIPEDSPLDIATICFNKYGFYPISFVLMRDMQITRSPHDKTKLISEVIPGNPYSFENEHEMYSEYQESEFAFTYRKCGWDSYRNIEILSHYAFPLYLEVKNIPRFCMTFYPKKQIQHVTQRFLKSPFHLSEDFKETFFDSALSQLNTSFLIEYLIKCVGFHPKSVLFFDESLDIFKGDYQSMMTLKSLTKIPNVNLTLVQNLDYLFSYEVDDSDLYGRGFGYKGMLEGVDVNRQRKIADDCFEEFDWIVVGSAARNMKFIENIDSHLRNRLILVWGEDRPPMRKELKFLKSKSDHIFIREINHPFVVP